MKREAFNTSPRKYTFTISCIAGVFMLSTEFTGEQKALQYINANEQQLFDGLLQDEIKTIYTNVNTRINIVKDGKRLLRVTVRFQGDKKISEIYKDMVDLRLL